jgi:hypothetical protein
MPTGSTPPAPTVNTAHSTGEQPSGKEIFEILVRDHTAMVLAYLRCRVLAPDAVDDLYQETMLTTWRRLAEYDRERAFGPWVRSRGAARPTRPRSRWKSSVQCRRCTVATSLRVGSSERATATART